MLVYHCHHYYQYLAKDVMVLFYRILVGVQSVGASHHLTEDIIRCLRIRPVKQKIGWQP